MIPSLNHVLAGFDAVSGLHTGAVRRALVASHGALETAGIRDSVAWAHFLAQTSHESMGYRTLSENLNYSKGRLLVVFSKYFAETPSDKKVDPTPFVHNPEALANKVYGGRLGNDKKGDGYRYKGRSIIQITGKNNYRAASEHIGIDFVKNPELAEDPEYAWLISVWFFTTATRKGSSLTPLDWALKNNCAEVTRIINGGYNGLHHRELLTADALTAINVGLATITLRLGVNNYAAVFRLQSMLQNVGIPVGAIDGLFGGKTDRAVRVFQSGEGLVVDGIVGPTTWKALTEAQDDG